LTFFILKVYVKPPFEKYTFLKTTILNNFGRMNNALAPFSCKYTSQIPELLSRLNCSLAISTYQAGKLIFISANKDESLIQLPRTFNKPMGIALDETGNKLT
jgi:hypothetical protein